MAKRLFQRVDDKSELWPVTLLMWCSVLCKDGAVAIPSGHVDGISRTMLESGLRISNAFLLPLYIC